MRDSDDEIVYVMSPENLLRALIISAGIPGGGFDTPEFREILKTAKNETIRAGIECPSIINMLSEETNKYGSNEEPGKTGFGSGVKMYGLPADGVSSGVAVYPSDFCVIPDGAKNKRAAWEFLKTYLDTVPDYRTEHYDGYWLYLFLTLNSKTGFTLKSASERNFIDNESVFCFYQNGEEIVFTIWADDEKLAEFGLGERSTIPKSAFRRYAKMIEDAGNPMPDKQWQTIKEICAGYFDGTASLDETIIRLTLSSAAE